MASERDAIGLFGDFKTNTVIINTSRQQFRKTSDNRTTVTKAIEISKDAGSNLILERQIS